MGHSALEVADLFRAHGPAWRQAQAGHLSLGQLKVMAAIEQCRSAALGGHVLRCTDSACAHLAIAYNSCPPLMLQLVPEDRRDASKVWLVRDLAALAEVDTSSLEAADQMRRAAAPVRRRGRSYRGFNPASTTDERLFAAILRGEHAIHGLRNQDVRCALFGDAKRPKLRRRHSGRVTRLLKRLHAHGLIAKIPHSRRWRTTAHGRALMIASLKFHHHDFTELVDGQSL